MNNKEPFLNRKTYYFGDKLKNARENKNLTLRAVATQAGVSESLVSQIERNKVSPAIDTLLSLADVLDINLEYLFEEYNRRRPVQIIRSDERRKVHEDTIVYEEITTPAGREEKNTIESYVVEIPVGESTKRGSYGHIGKEMGFILEGKAVLHYQNVEYELNEGDSVTFSASSPHTIENRSNKTLKAIWIVTPAQKFV